MADVSNEHPEPATARPRARPDLLSLGAGLASVAWLPLGLWPDMGLPAWPSASLGLAALVLSWLPGSALPRGLGAFLGLMGLVLGIAQIAAQWAVVDLIPGA